MKTLKLNNLKSLSTIVNPVKSNSDKWLSFLKDKGHTVDTFSYLPESLQLALKFSFAKKN